MAEMVVSASMGVMNPLLAKLTVLMGDEYKKFKGVGKQVPFLRDELRAMNAFLEKLAFMDDDELDSTTRDWRNNVREMSYDMEDCIDNIMYQLNGAEAGFVKKIVRRLKTVRARHQIAIQINDLKARVVEANDRRKRYELGDCRSGCPVVTVDPRIPTLYKESASLVGIDGPREELVEWLTTSEQQLKVVSVVGFGGLGKTTLAKAVYDKIEGQFNCKSFVSVSQRPDMTRLLQNIERNIGKGESSQACEVKDIIDGLRGYLADKRYIIIVDDLWDQQAWDIIKCAFLENDKGSRVIVTTRVEDVACWACDNHQYMYKMKPLSEHDSKRLFMRRIFGSEDNCPTQYEEVSAEILKKCGGLPLAIITIASLLASRPSRIMEEWESIRNSLGSPFGTNPSLEGMRQILNLSYKNLPLHLRTCLQYLGKYPEDMEIKRDDLIRQWIAEGFVVINPHGQDLEDVGKSYFNELVNRSLIQLVNMERWEVSCKVHDMMLDLILRRCARDNFFSVAYSCEDMARPQRGYSKVRRLSLDTTKLEYKTIEAGANIPVSLSQVRSVALRGEFTERIPLLPFQNLRVLDFYVTVISEDVIIDLTFISKLTQLRYLKFGSWSKPRCIKLPGTICSLVHLETLIIRLFVPVKLPSDVVNLARLSCLIVPLGTVMPDGMGSMKSIRTLDSLNFLNIGVKVLGELTNLRDLNLYCCKGEGSSETATAEIIDLQFDALGSSLRELRHLRRLAIYNCDEIYFDRNDRLGSLCGFAAHGIELLRLEACIFPRVPIWMNAGLCNLRWLDLLVTETSTDELSRLGELPSLVNLALFVRRHDGEASLMLGTRLLAEDHYSQLWRPFDSRVLEMLRPHA